MMRVAVIGSGVSGLGAAYLLARRHDVCVFERAARPGGHANTVLHRGLALDTGFLVHNTRTYPFLVRLLRELGVGTHESEMSFSVSCSRCGLEYAGRSPFAQRANAIAPGFLALLWEIGRWLRTARAAVERLGDEDRSLAEFLDEQGYSDRFRRHFIVPLTSALWSAAPSRALELPAASAIRFFDNHGMLGFRRLRWRTITGGSRAYVQAIASRLGPALRLELGVRSLRRTPDGVEVRCDDDTVRRFDHVVVATHADEALALLEDPSADERRLLGAFEYTTNEAVLHTDAALLPRAPRARASWNYRVARDGPPTVTYHLNRLQALAAEVDYLVTLNAPVREDRLIARFTYRHPLFGFETLRAQRELPALGGRRRTWFAGAYFGNGFHEDGLASGVRAAAALGAPW